MRTLITLIFAGLTLQGSAQQFTWTPQVSGTSQWLNDITFKDRNHGWAVGTNGVIVSTENGGESWITRSSGTSEELHSVFFLNQDTGWAAGGTSLPVLLHTTDGGKNWAPIEADFPGALSLRDIEFADALNGYAISANQIYRTGDGGSNWQPGAYSSLIISIVELGDLFALSGSSAFACGYYRNKSNEMLPGIFENMTLPEGQWFPQGSGGFDPEDTLTALCFTASRTGFSGSTTGKIYTMREEGGIFPRPWTLNFETHQGRVHSIAFPTDRHGMLNVNGKDNGKEVQFIYHTADTGATWSANPDLIPDMISGSLAAPDVNHAWMAGSNGKIFHGVRTDPVAVRPVEAFSLTVRPNPFTTLLVIESTVSLQKARFELQDLTGKVIRSGPMEDATHLFTLNGLGTLHSGVYILRIRSAENKLNQTQKVVKF